MNRYGLIEYFIRNSVIANLLMLFIIVIGLYSWNNLQRELFSIAEIGKISIVARLPGASPEEVEESITIKIEEALKGISELTRVYSDSAKGYVRFILDVKPDEAVAPVVSAVERKINAVSTFPSDMERLSIAAFTSNQAVLRLILSGSLKKKELRNLGNEIRNELLQLENVNYVEFTDLPQFEVAIEAEPRYLRQYQITLKDVAEQIALHSKNMSAGSVKTDAGEMLIRLDEQSYIAEEFASIPIVAGRQGQQVLLKDIAVIKDGFTEQHRYSRFNGLPATSLEIYALQKDSMPLVADSIYRYVENKARFLPSGVSLRTFEDNTVYLNERINMMLGNLFQGAILVFIALAIFLRIQVAIWVVIGVPVAFLGAVMMMHLAGISINATTLFAFIMAIGIVVDDAVVIGESAYAESAKRGHTIENILSGIKKVSMPVTFGVLTTMVVFIPMLFAEGDDAGQFIDLAAVVIFILIFSLVEARLILPGHLAGSKLRPLPAEHPRHRINGWVKRVIEAGYKPILVRALNNGAFTFSIFLALLLISVSLLTSNAIQTVYLPKIAGDTPKINVSMNNLITEAQSDEVMLELEGIIQNLNQQSVSDTGKPLITDIFTHVRRKGSGTIHIALADEDVREWDAFELSRRLYPAMSAVPGVRSIDIIDQAIPQSQGADIGYRLYGKDLDVLQRAANVLMAELSSIEGVYNITSTIDSTVSELSLKFKASAYALGLSPVEVSRQVNAGFYGYEAQRIVRDGQDIRVMVRYSEDTRSRLDALRDTPILTPTGDEVPLSEVVNIVEEQTIPSIRREGGFRSVLILADVDTTLSTPLEVSSVAQQRILPNVLSAFPGVRLSPAGAIPEQRLQRNQMINFAVISLNLVFVLLAIPLRSYIQPLIILSVIPFSLIGAIWGHYIFGYNFSLFSLFGIIAAMGVVINDSLVMVSTANRFKEPGVSKFEAVIRAAKSRFRAVILTSVTTFLGLVPIMFESSVQGQYLAPMAISLAFALIVSTLTTLFLVPLLYTIGERRNREPATI